MTRAALLVLVVLQAAPVAVLAWSAPHAPRAPARRTAAVLAQFGQPRPPVDDDAEPPPPPPGTPERAKFEAGEGNLFFQAPTPLTGEQSEMDDFFGKGSLGKEAVPLQLKVFGGLFTVLFLWLVVQLVIS